MTSFILAQVLGIIALILVCLSYSFNNKRSFLAYQILANLFYSASFLSLGVLVGGLNTIVSIVRVAVLYIYEKKDKSPPIWLYVVFALAYLITGNVCYQSNLDIMAVIAYEMFNVAMFLRYIEITRYMMVLPNCIIVIYNILSQTYTNAILDFVEIVVLVSMIVRYSWARQNRKIRYLI